MIKWIVGILAVLVVVSLALPKPEEKPEDRKYESIGDLRRAVGDAGYKCPKWGEAEESRDLSGSIWIQTCSNGDSLLWADGAYGRKVEERREVCSDIQQLGGRNWEFESDQAEKFHDALGGVLCDGTPKPAP